MLLRQTPLLAHVHQCYDKSWARPITPTDVEPAARPSPFLTISRTQPPHRNTKRTPLKTQIQSALTPSPYQLYPNLPSDNNNRTNQERSHNRALKVNKGALRRPQPGQHQKQSCTNRTSTRQKGASPNTNRPSRNTTGPPPPNKSQIFGNPPCKECTPMKALAQLYTTLDNCSAIPQEQPTKRLSTPERKRLMTPSADYHHREMGVVPRSGEQSRPNNSESPITSEDVPHHAPESTTRVHECLKNREHTT